VAVNSDESVSSIKGPKRPLTPEGDRSEIIAALECVDFVCIFGEETASSLVAEVQPAVYVKGGDYSSDPHSDRFPVEGEAAVRSGGRVEIIEYIPGRSTTDIVNRLTSTARTE
jgi:D-beta-D-heptose 7-phosphate kinase/D-beta-D-heptose 1-phosphate adenosyltransferase